MAFYSAAMDDSISNQILTGSRVHNLPESLIRAIMMVESGGNADAIRYEPGYPWLWDVIRSAPHRVEASETMPDDFPFDPRISSRATEFVGQRISWGPMQIMGATARELGFKGRFPELCGPSGILFATRYLARLRDKFQKQYGEDGVIAAYNAGTPRLQPNGSFANRIYVDKVRALAA